MGCMLHAPQADNVFDLGSSGVKKLSASDTKFGTLVHLGNAYFAPYEIRGCGALCACIARANYFHLLLFPVPTGQTVGTADAKLAGHMSAIPAYMFLWLPFVWGAGCARQDRKSLFERGPPVLGNFELLTPNLVH